MSKIPFLVLLPPSEYIARNSWRHDFCQRVDVSICPTDACPLAFPPACLSPYNLQLDVCLLDATHVWHMGGIKYKMASDGAQVINYSLSMFIKGRPRALGF